MFKANQNARRDYSSLKRDCFFAFKMFFFVWQITVMKWLYTGLSHVWVAAANLDY